MKEINTITKESLLGKEICTQQKKIIIEPNLSNKITLSSDFSDYTENKQKKNQLMNETLRKCQQQTAEMMDLPEFPCKTGKATRKQNFKNLNIAFTKKEPVLKFPTNSKINMWIQTNQQVNVHRVCHCCPHGGRRGKCRVAKCATSKQATLTKGLF